MSKTVTVVGESGSSPLTITISGGTSSASLKQAIRSHFSLKEETVFILTDSEGNDVVTDLNLPEGSYNLAFPKKSGDDEDVEMSVDDSKTAKKTKIEISEEDRFSSLVPLLSRKSPFAPSGFQPDASGTLDYLGSNVRVLVVGAGGLGCELLKDLAYSGFKDIDVIDMDTIDVSNLNRQFLFRMKDTSRYKSDVAAEFIMKRIKGVKVTPHTKNIMEFSKDWYRKFNIVIAGLDNIEARDWLNKTLVDMVEFDEDGEINWDTLIPFIDGGTTGFAGQARVVIPYQTACYHCTLQSLPPEEGFHLCTIASKPRKPEHCIAYALIVEWSRLEEFKSSKDYKLGKEVTVDKDGNPEVEEGKVKLDKDNPEHMKWITDRAQERAEKFGIKGVTYFMAMQVVKNIIPALASTNAIVSAACVNEALKIVAQTHPHMDSYWQFFGTSGISCRTFPYARDPECDVCSSPVTWIVKPSDTLASLMERVKKLFTEDKDHKAKAPTLSLGDGKILYTDVAGMDYSEELSKPLFALGVANKTMLVATNGQRTRRLFIKTGK